MEEPWNFEFLSRIADSCLSFLSEFVTDWLANDMRVSIFKILLSWLIFSLIAIHFAWKVYGNTVNDMYYRQGELCFRVSPFLYCSLTSTFDEVYVCVLMFRGWTERGHTWDCTSPQWMVGVRQSNTDITRVTNKGKAGSGLNYWPLLWVRWLCYAVADFAGVVWAHLPPVQGRNIANKYRLVLNNHLDFKMRHIYPDGSGVIKDDNPSEGWQLGFCGISISVGDLFWD